MGHRHIDRLARRVQPGTKHFQHSGRPEDEDIARAYAEGPTADLQDRVGKGHAAMEPKDADPQAVARAIASVVELPAGKRPFHITVDPADMGYEVMAAMGDRIRSEIMRAMGLGDILTPASARALSAPPGINTATTRGHRSLGNRRGPAHGA